MSKCSLAFTQMTPYIMPGTRTARKSNKMAQPIISALAHKRILLGVTGGIAAYKSADLIRRLREAGATVQVVMTENAKQFITPLTLQAVSGQPVRDNLFDSAAEAAMGHIELARWADLILVAPASADFIARLACGRADDLLTTLALATQAPLALAPAMNRVMWENSFTQKNVAALRKQGVTILGPAEGSQACGEVGPGRMLEPAELVQETSALFNTGAFAGLKVLITAGPTHEALDPVRFLTNASSGKMGYALAEAALEAGATTTLISGPVNLASTIMAQKEQAKLIKVVTAQEMYEAVLQQIKECDLFIAVAAVADYRCKQVAKQKIHKDAATLRLELERTPDIVAEVAKLKKKPFIVGFAAETEKLVAKAKEKRMRKGMDVIIANRVGEGLGFDSDENAVTVLWQDKAKVFPRTSKQKLARQLVAWIGKIYRGK
jgi:phosphopantothenoylcysteine decarboxylase/phosphopantothenate--cysteine ligase